MSTITIYHGTDIVKSRQAFIAQIGNSDPATTEIIRVEGKNIDDNFIQTTLYSPTMFHDQRLIAIETLFSLPKSDARDSVIKQLGQVPDCCIVIWEGKEIETKSYSAPFTFQLFNTPNELFVFLGQLTPANLANSLTFLERIRDLVDENYLFLMLVRQIRLLILAKYGETASLPPWQVAKLVTQANAFEAHQLTNLYRGLRDLDYNQKTSQSAGSYVSDIEFLLTNL